MEQLIETFTEKFVDTSCNLDAEIFQSYTAIQKYILSCLDETARIKCLSSTDALISMLFNRISALEHSILKLNDISPEELSAIKITSDCLNDHLIDYRGCLIDLQQSFHSNDASNFIMVFASKIDKFTFFLGACGCVDCECLIDALLSESSEAKIKEFKEEMSAKTELLQEQIQQCGNEIYIHHPSSGESYLGGGSFGTTHRMKNIVEKRLYAVKEFSVGSSQFDVEVTSMQKESSVLHLLNHLHIVKYFGSFVSVDKNRFCVVMNLASGGTLASNTKLKTASLDCILKWFRQLSSALHYIHYEMQFQHRDISAENIVLIAGNNIIIIDFGLASIIKTKSKGYSKGNTDCVGTCEYFSFEKAMELEYDGRDDVWATGCVIAELMVGKRLRDTGGGVFMIHNSTANERRNQLIQDCKTIDSRCGSIVELMLEPLQENRCTSKELVELLDDSVAWQMHPRMRANSEVSTAQVRFGEINHNCLDELAQMTFLCQDCTNLYKGLIPGEMIHDLKMFEAKLSDFSNRWTEEYVKEDTYTSKFLKLHELQEEFDAIKRPLLDIAALLEKKLDFIKKNKLRGEYYTYIGFGDNLMITGDLPVYLLTFRFNSVLQMPHVWSRNVHHMSRLKSSTRALFFIVDLDTYAGSLPFDLSELPPSNIAIHLRNRGKWKHDIVLNEPTNDGMSYTCNTDSFTPFTETTTKPKDGQRLAMPCPLGCGGGLVFEWLCCCCCTQVEFVEVSDKVLVTYLGANKTFMCLCGYSPIRPSNYTSYKFRCSCHPKFSYSNFDSFDPFLLALSNIEKNVLNVLLFGATGVGKTTFINSLANYMTSSLQSILKDNCKNLKCLCNVEYEYFKSETEIVKVKMKGELNNNDSFASMSGVGSHTLKCVTYTFYWDTRIIKLIDTPGAHDTGGSEYDVMNNENIMAYLTQYKNINAFLFLIKSGENRLTTTFTECFRQLVTKLNKNALQNIMFVYTNCRYEDKFLPDEVDRVLKALLLKEDIGLTVNPSINSFTVNNEFKWLVCVRGGKKYTSRELTIKSESWKHSSRMCRKMFDNMYKMESHCIAESLSLFYINRTFQLLSVPLGSIIEIIKKDTIELEKFVDDKREFVQIEQTEFEIEYLDNWRTQCTHSDCCGRYYDKSGKEIKVFTNVCEECTTARYDNRPGSQIQHVVCYSQLFPGHTATSVCNKCGHSPANHIVTKVIYNKKCSKKWILRDEIGKKIEGLYSALNRILELGAEFGYYITKNSSGFYFTDYLEVILNNQIKSLPSYFALVKALQECKDEYIRVRSQIVGNFTLEDMQNKIKSLYVIPTYGQYIKEVIALQCEITPVSLGINDSYRPPPRPASIRKGVSNVVYGKSENMRDPINKTDNQSSKTQCIIS